MAICIPLGVGFKYNLTEKLNFTFEVSHRFTNTDYLDDVSTTYIGAGNFPVLPNGQPSKAALLQDRSNEIDPTKIIGLEGRQRGWSKQKDQYIIAEIGLSMNIGVNRCPSAD